MRFNASVSPLNSAAILVSLLLLTGCAAQGPTEATVATDKVMSHDGLYPVEKPRADAAWARPDADISVYSKVMLEGVGVQFRPGAKSRSTRVSSSSDYYVVPPERKERLKEIFAEKFREELGKSEHFTLVNETGPDVLLVRAELIDVVSYVPPPQSGRYEIFLERIGEATLVLELIDSESDAVIARAVDRRAAENISRDFQRSNRATNTAEVRRLAGIWARILREQLDTYAST